MKSNSRFYEDIMSIHDGVTGTCLLNSVSFPNGEKLLFAVDCGLFQEREYEYLNETLPFNGRNVDFCLVTHNHVDHTGRLPLMVKAGFSGGIYATETTCKLLPLALEDSFKVLREAAKKKKTRPLYNEMEVEKTLSQLKPCAYQETIKVHEHVKVTFFDNGHLIGAAVILVQISYPGYEDINLLFTGDYRSYNTFYDVRPLPDWVLKLPLTIIQESTYGDRDTDDMQPCFKENIQSCLKDGGTAVTMVFSLGRAQEILYELKTMQKNGTLDKEIPIYFDGKLGIRYTNLFLEDGLDIKPEMKDFLPENLTYVNKETRMSVLKDVNKKIILTTSGMGSDGPAQLYIPEYLKRENALLQFAGYTAEGTLGSRLKNAQMNEKVEIAGQMIVKRARIEYAKEYSGHAKANELIAFLKPIERPKLILINHGRTQVKQIYKQRVIKEVQPKQVEILGRDYFFRVNPYGLEKVLPTKFDKDVKKCVL
ncbi:MAG: MBL fold metallo-hydrolase [Clostridia bacterium]